MVARRRLPTGKHFAQCSALRAREEGLSRGSIRLPMVFKGMNGGRHASLDSGHQVHVTSATMMVKVVGRDGLSVGGSVNENI
jgi:hypothetical protein